jgi:hypothetical protein
MIFQALKFIRTQLNTTGLVSELGNIGELLSGQGGLAANTNADVIISLVNIEENRISRDPRNYRQNGTGILLKNPAVHLYLTLLFTATRSDAYELALKNLQSVIQFFQHKCVFDAATAPGLDQGIEKLVLDMVSINLEALNQLWSILGSRYQPSVIYKMRMITIDSVTEEPGSVVQEIETKWFMA